MLEFYHVTAKKNLLKIAQEGINADSFWASGDFASGLVDYYSETVEDEGDTPVVLRVFLDDLDQKCFKPDVPGLEEPITTVVGKSENAVWEDWQNSKKTWESCIEIIGSCKYTQVIPAKLVFVDNEDDVVGLGDFVATYISPKPKLK